MNLCRAGIGTRQTWADARADWACGPSDHVVEYAVGGVEKGGGVNGTLSTWVKVYQSKEFCSALATLIYFPITEIMARTCKGKKKVLRLLLSFLWGLEEYSL